MSPKNIIDKIWNEHVVKHEKGVPDVLFIDLQLIHEVTTPQAFQTLRDKNLTIFDPTRTIATVDHSIPTDLKRENYKDKQTRKQVEMLRKNCRDFGLKLYDTGSGHQGVVHVTGPELGLTQPGQTIVCGDSHTATHGAFGAIAFGIGTTQILHVLATQCLLLEKPKTMRVNFIGKPSKYFTAKDAILLLIQQIGIQGGTGYAMEFCGDFIKNISMEGRMTICNMAIECGAKSGLISPDRKTIEYLRTKPASKKIMEDNPDIINEWLSLASTDKAVFDAVVDIHLDGQRPIVTWGTNPEQSITVNEKIPDPQVMADEAKALAAKKSLDYTQLKAGDPIIGTPIDYVFIGSCTNGRIEDFRAVANILKGKKIHNRITMLCVPGSEVVRAQCIAEGLDKIFMAAGVDFRASGCSMCLAMNGDIVPSGKRCASTSNRNFVGRQGVGSFTHLMSPLMAAICAIKGEITDPELYFNEIKNLF